MVSTGNFPSRICCQPLGMQAGAGHAMLFLRVATPDSVNLQAWWQSESGETQ